jgi:hypothetical protein
MRSSLVCTAFVFTATHAIVSFGGQAGFCQTGDNTNTMNTPGKTISCKLTTPELQKRKLTVLAELKSLVLERKERSDGYSFRFEASDNMLDKLTEFIKTERACCDFFTYGLTIEENTAWLSITGPPGAKDFIQDEMGL